MRQRKPFRKSSAVTAVLFCAAVALLAAASIGGARAALTYYSDTYTTEIGMYDIGVSLLENGETVSLSNYEAGTANETKEEGSGVLLEHLIPEGEVFRAGTIYPEELAVSNTGTINEYVRVTIRKYWLNAEGERMQELSPALIDLDFINTGSDWIIDEASSTAERTVLYYTHLLPSQDVLDDAAERAKLPSGADSSTVSAPFTDTISVDPVIMTKVSQTTEQTEGGTRITTAYDYDGVTFVVEATVNSVQEHNASDAALSAWGRNVTIRDGRLSLE